VENEAIKLEALRLATVVLCQGATAGKGDDKPAPADVLEAAKTFYEWFKG
jgi:hypothetical protein